MSTDFWVDALSVGVDSFDQAHREQLNTIGRIEAALSRGDKVEAIALIDHLHQHLTVHQTEEIDLLVRTGYPGLDLVRQIQSSSLSRLNRLRGMIEGGDEALDARRLATEMRMAFVDYLLKGDINFKSHLDMVGYGHHR